jgi:hypothetical protein
MIYADLAKTEEKKKMGLKLPTVGIELRTSTSWSRKQTIWADTSEVV